MAWHPIQVLANHGGARSLPQQGRPSPGLPALQPYSPENKKKEEARCNQLHGMPQTKAEGRLRGARATNILADNAVRSTFSLHKLRCSKKAGTAIMILVRLNDSTDLISRLVSTNTKLRFKREKRSARVMTRRHRPMASGNHPMGLPVMIFSVSKRFNWSPYQHHSSAL